MARSPGGEDDDVPHLPRGRGIKLSSPEILRIVLFAGMLVAVIVLAKPCGNAVSGFVMKFDKGSNAAASGSGSARGAQMPRPGNVEAPAKVLPPDQYEHLRPGMSEQEVKAAMERASEKARERAAAAGSGTAAGTGSGTGTGSAAGTGSGTGTGSAAGSGSVTRP